MGKFVPSQHVEGMTYDFTEYGGIEGTIPEPTQKRVKDYFRGVKTAMNELRELRALAGKDIEDLSDEEAAELMAKMDDSMEDMERVQDRLVHWMAYLCGGDWVDPDGDNGEAYVKGGSPSVDQLSELPFRVYQAFTAWLNGEIQPKRKTPGTKR